MTAPTYNLTLTQGKTFSQPLQYAESFLLYRPITAVTSKAPLRVEAADHGIPDGWPVRIQGVAAPNSMNTPQGEYWNAHVVTPDIVEFNELDISLDPAYVEGGNLVFRQPADITGWKVRMHIRASLGGAVLMSLSSDQADGADGVITLDSASSSFVLNLTAAQTAAITWKGALYDIEGIRPDGAVVEIIAPSTIKVNQEVTVWA